MQIPLGVIPKNENVAEEMVEIMDKMSEYIPELQAEGSEESEVYPLAFAGDMLTAARARTAQEIRVTSSGKKALRGLFPIAADWHAKVNFMEVRMLLTDSVRQSVDENVQKHCLHSVAVLLH